ncbi:MAG TPA: hypothetical protein VLD39_17490 [Gammaproteobacteria bacterium]|nr:hypothetical protein [Gammaproteobacteria bacterium]
MTDDLTVYRLQRESEDLERYEAALLETAACLKLYRQHHGHEPASMAALTLWAEAALEQPLDPYQVLTREEIAQLWEDAEH